MTDTWNVTAVYDKPSYNKGDTMKITITGGLTSSAGTSQSGTLTLTVTAGSSTTTITLPPVTISSGGTTTTPGKLTNVADTSGRAWTIAADGLSATAIA